ncbi:anaerobic sulfatase maturase [uncultured Desulfobulbus sp.]|uniref:anaerobic sulfatase maturase n=1 Tax=uncultured Desulfobulbus sp. TaxID=239745 RepID=UPI0029C690B4|nr:anaerobic sulfatase maturase [uncultured Desulfobulbus sp.]
MIHSKGPAILLPEQPEGYKHRFHAMVKPLGSLCNLNCTYCYYLSKQGLLQQPAAPRMSDDILELHIRQYIEAQTGDEVVFSWQGGEPTLMGLDFFRTVVELQAQYKKPQQRIENDLQTNGTLLDTEWATFLKQHNFLVGLSCDGPQRLHDRYRVTKDGQPTHAKVMDAARLLRKHGVPFNALCVVNRENAHYPLDVYRFLTRELGVWRVQFISCVEPKVFRDTAPQHWDAASLPVVDSAQAKPGTPDSVVTDWSVDPDDWGRFLCKVWDDWYKRDYGKIHVDLFETAVAQSLGWPSQRCITSEFCGKGMAIEHSGDVFSCDHYVYPEYRVGTISETHWSQMAYSEAQKHFGFAKSRTLPQYCRQCPHLRLCWGECPKNRLVRAPDGEMGLNYLCSGMKQFYDHIQHDMPEITRRVKGSGR